MSKAKPEPKGARPRRAPLEETRRFNEALNVAAAEQDRINFEVLSKNVVYLWRAIEAFRVVNDDRKLAGEPPLQLPEWIVAELGIMARRVMDIAEGKDWREAPEPFGLLPADTDALDRARARKAHLDPDLAVKAVMQALGFRSKGTNAFASFSRQNADVLDALSHDLYTGRLLGPNSEPVENLSKLEKLEDGPIITTPAEASSEAQAIRMLLADAKAAPSADRRTRRRKVHDKGARDVAGMDDDKLAEDAMRRRVRRGRQPT